MKTGCISRSPGVSISILEAGPVPAPLTAATKTVYIVLEVSSETVADLALLLSMATTLSSSPLVLATTV